jgi:hypothetical protein
MKRAAPVFFLCVIVITLGGCVSTLTREELIVENARLQALTPEELLAAKTPPPDLTPEELTVEKARLQILTREQLIAEKIRSQNLTDEQRIAEQARLQALTREQLIVENTPPQALTSEQLMAANARLQERTIAEKIRLSRENADLSKDKNFLQTVLLEAVRVPITPQIVNQVKAYSLSEDMRYYTSVTVSLLRDNTGQSSSDLKPEPLRLEAETGPNPQGITVLTYTEGGSSSAQTPISITSRDEGQLKESSLDLTVFEIEYPGRQIILGFVLNPVTGWYDLDFMRGAGGERIPLILTGSRPHLMTDFWTKFSGNAQAQRDPRPAGQAASPSPTSQAPASGPVTSPYDQDFFAGDSTEWQLPDPLDQNDYSFNLVPAGERPPVPEYSFTTGSEEANEVSPAMTVKLLVTGSDPAAAPAVFLPDTSYVLQVGAYHDRKNAAAAYTVLEREGFSPRYEDYQNLTRVVLPSVARNDLARTREKLKALGLGEPYVRQ